LPRPNARLNLNPCNLPRPRGFGCNGYGEQTYVLADGSKSKSITFTIRSLKIGDTIVKNVKGSVASPHGMLLLGQSFLERFKSWSVDNARRELVLEQQ
jgi:predicted aspartyl protease